MNALWSWEQLKRDRIDYWGYLGSIVECQHFDCLLVIMYIKSDINLSPYHTFGVNQTCRWFIEIHHLNDLIEIYGSKSWQNTPKLILGKGSNLLFTCPYQGLIIRNCLQGIQHEEDEYFHYLHVSSGEDWPSFVAWSLEQGYAGLENLALIPGCAGSAPVQNIGAYGVEFSERCHYVDYLCLDSLKVQRLTVEDCHFGYRDSVFKQALKHKAVIVAVGLKLAKNWQAVTHYGPLQNLVEPVSALQIYQKVCQVRREKLPDPRLQGNAGSFFKNPEVTKQQWQTLVQHYPDIVGYPIQNKIKIAAAWLIDKAQLKGVKLGQAQVHHKQPLVILNLGQAQAQDIIGLALKVQQKVRTQFGIELEPEVRFIGAQHELTLTECGI